MNKTWTIPAIRMKAGEAHIVPLAPATLAIIEYQRSLTTGDAIFPGRGCASMNETALMRVLRKLGYQHETVHGLRATFRIWCAEQTSYPREIPELCLAHAVGSIVEQSYQRSTLLDKRRELMNDYASYCGKPQRMPLPASLTPAVGY